MDLFFKAVATALTANPLNLALCCVFVLTIAVVVIAWNRR